MSVSTLKLFGVVPDIDKTGTPQVIEEYGVVVSPTASYAIKQIRAYLKQNGVGEAEKNSSFWKDWQSVRTMSDYQMRLDQLLHYFSTYGMELFGIDAVKEGLVYVPIKIFTVQGGPIALRVIDAAKPQELIDRCFALLNSGMALSQETIGDIIAALGECGYMITGKESIKNREAEIYFYMISGKLPVGSNSLFRYLVYHFTEQSMVINDKKTRETIANSNKKLLALSEKELAILAQSFNRYKDLWMAIKQAHPKNRSVVNRITKLSKTHHKPMPEVVMNNLTSKHYTPEVIKEAASKATVFQLIRVINSLRLRRANPEGAVYRIRNSRIWTSLAPPSSNAHTKYVEEMLIGILRERFADVRVYAENFVDFSLPTTEKSFVGNVPEGTVLRFPKTSEALLIGVHWDEPNTDLDLRADSANFSVGWNSSFRTGSRGVMLSGDMTRAPAPYGASEWLYFTDLNGTYNVKLNEFRAGPRFDKKFKLMIGRSSDKISMNYQIAPEKVLVSYVVTMEDRQVSLGIVYPDGNHLCFLMGTGATGGRHVGRYNKYDSIQQDVAAKRIQSSLRLADVVQFVSKPEDATVNLSLETLTKDSFLNILK
jgi:hypothetical protein